MSIGKINEKYFLSPREAIEQLVGPATFDNWDFNKTEHIKLATGNLLKALQSGNVEAYYSDFDGFPRLLRPELAADQFFKIDAKRDCCFLGAFSPHPNDLKIKLADLEKYIRSQKSPLVRGSIRSETQCEYWLTELFKSADRPPNREELLKAAREKFSGLTAAGYWRARASALKASGREDLRAGGAPRGRRVNSLTQNRTDTPK